MKLVKRMTAALSVCYCSKDNVTKRLVKHVYFTNWLFFLFEKLNSIFKSAEPTIAT